MVSEMSGLVWVKARECKWDDAHKKKIKSNRQTHQMMTMMKMITMYIYYYYGYITQEENVFEDVSDGWWDTQLLPPCYFAKSWINFWMEMKRTMIMMTRKISVLFPLSALLFLCAKRNHFSFCVLWVYSSAFRRPPLNKFGVYNNNRETILLTAIHIDNLCIPRSTPFPFLIITYSAPLCKQQAD